MKEESWIVNVLRDIESFAEVSGMTETKVAIELAIQRAQEETISEVHESAVTFPTSGSFTH